MTQRILRLEVAERSDVASIRRIESDPRYDGLVGRWSEERHMEEMALASSRYFVLREDRRSVVVVTEKDGARDEQTITLDSDDVMRWQVLQGKTITFERVAEPKDKKTAAKSSAP